MRIFSTINFFLQLKVTYGYEISQNQKVNNKNQNNHIRQYNGNIIDSIKIYLFFFNKCFNF